MDNQPNKPLKGPELLAASYATAFAANYSGSQWTKVADLETKNAAMWSLLQERDNRIRRLEAEVETLREVSAEARSASRELFVEKDQLEKRLADLVVQYQECSTELEKKNQAVSKLVAALAETKDDVSKLVRGAVGAYAEQLEAVMADASDARAQATEALAQLETMQAEGAQEAREAQAVKEITAECAEIRERAAREREQMQALKYQEVSALEEQVGSLVQQKEQLGAQLDQVQRELTAALAAAAGQTTVEAILGQLQDSTHQLTLIIDWIVTALNSSEPPSALLLDTAQKYPHDQEHQAIKQLNSLISRLREAVVAKYAESLAEDPGSCGMQ